MDHAAKGLALHPGGRGKQAPETQRTIPVVAFGLALSIFFAISFGLCVLSYLVVPTWPISHAMLAMLLPGFVMLNLTSFILGLLESVVWGWYIALILGPLYNFLAARTR